jgi:muconate cycloisomerase
MNDLHKPAPVAGTSARIESIECVPLNIPFKIPFKIASGAARPVVETLIVKIHTDAGVTGVGETQAWRRQGSGETLENLINVVKNHFEPRLLGRSPFDIASIMHGLNEAMFGTYYSQAAVGDALYDAAAKLLGVPVWQLLGGKCRDRVRVASVLSIRGTVESLVESAEVYHAQGFRHFVLKIGVDPAEDIRNVEALRDRFGNTVEIRVDANAELDFDTALRLLTKLEPYDIECAEQPLGIWDVDGMARLARAVRIPIMADESVSTDHGLIDIIRKGAASSAQTKIAKNGGIYHIRRLWHLLAAAGMGINPGNHPGTSVATSAVAQMCAAWPGPLMAGVFPVGLTGTLAEDIVENPIRLVDGEIEIPVGAGLGVTLDENALDRFRVET